MENNVNIMTFRASDGNTVKLEYSESLPSAADLARKYARSGYPDRYVVFTERQTAESAVGASVSESDGERGLYLSCILRPSIFPSQAGYLGALSAVALASALEEHTMQKMGIGWVSDIYCDGVKIGYTSVEGKLDSYTSYEYLIVSFAVRLEDKKFSPRLTDMVRRVFEDGNLSIPIIMAKTVLNKFFAIYREIKNPAKHLNHYVTRFALTDKKIKFIEGGKKKTVRVVGVSKTNIALIIETKDKRVLEITSPSSIVLPSKIK
ncbi:MAG: hypothetical protein IKJ25_01755 [Clostridia bacterium]|nr:hypothetical protein [Clostridia bacterium]